MSWFQISLIFYVLSFFRLIDIFVFFLFSKVKNRAECLSFVFNLTLLSDDAAEFVDPGKCFCLVIKHITFIILFFWNDLFCCRHDMSCDDCGDTINRQYMTVNVFLSVCDFAYFILTCLRQINIKPTSMC